MALSFGAKLAGAALLASAVGGVTWHRSAQSCVLGTFNAAATVTVSGFGADRTCQDVTSARGSGYYRRAAPVSPSDVVLCEVDARGLHWVVRDRGAFMLLGRATCDSMRRHAARGG